MGAYLGAIAGAIILYFCFKGLLKEIADNLKRIGDILEQDEDEGQDEDK